MANVPLPQNGSTSGPRPVVAREPQQRRGAVLAQRGLGAFRAIAAPMQRLARDIHRDLAAAVMEERGETDIGVVPIHVRTQQPLVAVLVADRVLDLERRERDRVVGAFGGSVRVNRDGQRGRKEGRPIDAAHLVVEHGLTARGELAKREKNPRGDARADEHRGRGIPAALQHEGAGGSGLGIEAHLAQFIDEKRFEPGDGRDQEPPGGTDRLGGVHGTPV